MHIKTTKRIFFALGMVLFWGQIFNAQSQTTGQGVGQVGQGGGGDTQSQQTIYNNTLLDILSKLQSSSAGNQQCWRLYQALAKNVNELKLRSLKQDRQLRYSSGASNTTLQRGTICYIGAYGKPQQRIIRIIFFLNREELLGDEIDTNVKLDRLGRESLRGNGARITQRKINGEERIKKIKSWFFNYNEASELAGLFYSKLNFLNQGNTPFQVEISSKTNLYVTIMIYPQGITPPPEEDEEVAWVNIDFI